MMHESAVQAIHKCPVLSSVVHKAYSGVPSGLHEMRVTSGLCLTFQNEEIRTNTKKLLRLTQSWRHYLAVK